MDLISREEAIKAIPETRMAAFENCRYCELLDREQVVEILKEIPSAQRWIPVSERMPEEDVEVLACNEDGDMEVVSCSYSTEIDGAVIWFTSGWRFGKVLAWMPLPEAYKEET